MKVKLDENLPASLGEVPLAQDHEVDTVIAEDLGGQPTPRWRQPLWPKAGRKVSANGVPSAL